MFILGISGYYHDSAACLLKGGNILAAAQEERFTRIKNDASFPQKSIEYCLAYAGIGLSEVDYIVFYEKPFLKFERLLDTFLTFAPNGIRSFLKAMPVWLKEKLHFKKMLIKALQTIDAQWKPAAGQLLFSKHHQSHAASAFFASPFSSAVILTVDGVGEWETTSVSVGKDNRIQPECHISFPHSLGLLYSAFTYHLGFKVNCDEYKVMGLAPYGQPVYLDVIFEELIDMKPDGSFRLNMRYFNYATGLTMTSGYFDELFNAVRRKPDEPIAKHHMNMAASIQAAAEKIMLAITTSLNRKYNGENLCLAGGVALNCVINAKILKHSGFKKIWVQPAAGDAGGALGAALAVYYQYLDNKRHRPAHDSMQNCLLGPEFPTEQVVNILSKYGLDHEIHGKSKLHSIIAAEIAGGKVIGYFSGRMEFGPRALGSRSILADARNPEMQSLLNQKIKFRESFRPFAPAVLEEFAGEYFDFNDTSPYMLMVAEVLIEKRITADTQPCDDYISLVRQARSVIPAVTHIDYSARLQTVNETDHPDFYQLIKAFYSLTGCPLVINTSFNRMDEPIVCTPEDAVRCFLNTEIDVLVINNFLVRKSVK